MPSHHAPVELLAALGRLREEVGRASLDLQTPGVEEARILRKRVLEQLVDYVLPRLVQLDAPMVAVVGGSTGAGKSTLVNSLVRDRVSESGILRPTTRSPVLIHHPSDAEWFAPDQLLPELPRVGDGSDATHALQVVPHPGVPAGIAILDAPDVDSIDDRNRELAAQLLDSADLWLFVTSSARYSDSVPWEYLLEAAERSASVAVVLDRTHPEAVDEVRRHLARIMTSRGLSDSPLFTIPESGLDHEGLLPRATVEPIRAWLHDLAGNLEARQDVIQRTLDGAVRQNVFAAHDLADAIEGHREAAAMLYSQVEECYRAATDEFSASLTDGTLFSGDVVSLWQGYVGSGDAVREGEEATDRLRDRVLEGIAGDRNRSADIAESLMKAIAASGSERAETGAETSMAAWYATDFGRALLEPVDGLDRASAEIRDKTIDLVESWYGDVQEAVRTAASDKRMTSSFLALGVNGLAVCLVIALVTKDAHVTALTDLARRLVDSVLGSEGSGRLLETVRSGLVDRVAVLFDAERARYLALVESPDSIAARQSSLREAARQAEYARHVDYLEREELG